MEAVPKSDIKSVIKSDIRFDISLKQTNRVKFKTRNSMVKFKVKIYEIP